MNSEPRERSSVGRLAFALAATVALVVVLPSTARAQGSDRGQPRTPFGVADLAKLHWLVGAWEGTALGEDTIYCRYQFSTDSTIDITYFRDRALTKGSADARVYLTTGRVYQTLGPGQWGATHVDENGVFFIPQVNAHNTFAWSYKSPDLWTSTMRTSVSGHEAVTVYQMRRIAR